MKSLQSHECFGELSLLLILLIFKLCECHSEDALLLIKVLDLSLRLLLNEDLHLGLQAREERLHIVWFQISSSQLVNLVSQLFDCKVYGVFIRSVSTKTLVDVFLLVLQSLALFGEFNIHVVAFLELSLKNCLMLL